MKKTTQKPVMKKATRKVTWKIVDKIIKNWDIETSIQDVEIMDDIRSAMKEAYLEGCCDGGLDKDVFEEALNYFKKEK